MSREREREEKMKTRLPTLVVACVMAVACCLIGGSEAAVFSIDFGSEWLKVALVKVSKSRVCLNCALILPLSIPATAGGAHGNSSEQVSR